MKKTIEIKGISTASTFTDGECMSVVNMRKKNGALIPVSTRKTIHTLASKYDETFVHQLPSTGENWIGVRAGKLWYIQNIGTPGQSDTELCTVASIPSITQIGNILNILDSTGLKHVMWYDNKYVQIDTNFDGDQNSTIIGPIKIDLRVSGTVGTTGKRLVRLYKTDTSFGYSNTGDADNSDNRQLRADASNGLLQKAISGMRSKGEINGFFYACTAIELYDGSFILHSNPVLCGSAWDTSNRYTNLAVDGQTFNYNDKKAIFWPKVNGGSILNGYGLGIDGQNLKILHDDTSETVISPEDDGSYKVELSADCMAFVPASTNKVATVTGYIPNLMGYYDKRYYDGAGVTSLPVWMWASSNKLQFRINQTIPAQYTSLIKSVSIFISPEVNPYKVTEKSKFIEQSRYSDSSSNNFCAENHFPPIKTTEEILKELKSSQQFYKVKEIAFSDLVTGNTTGNVTINTWIDVDLSDKLGDNLVNQDELPVDNMTHHTLLPQKQMVYNSRLHAIDYKTILSRGWAMDNLYANAGLGQFEALSHASDGHAWIIKTDIKTETGISTVVRYKPVTVENYLMPDKMSSMLSYPDSRAVKITITRILYAGGGWYSFTKEFPLTASETHNFSYYVSTDLKPMGFNYTDNVTFPLAIPAESQREQIFRNGMKVSSLNNPFNFPALNTYTVGTGIARNAASNAMRASDGQFGQYPVYVFTTENIYAMNTGEGSIVYSNITPISNETAISDIICQTPFGVVFIGKRGVFVINGQEVTMLSAVLEQNPVEISLNNPAVSLLEYLKTLKNMYYDPLQNELILVNGSAYNYVLNVTNQMWYLSTEKIDVAVGNVYPELLVMDDKKIKDYAQSEAPETNVSFMTRPIFYGIDERKKLHRMILRGRFYNLTTGNGAFYSLHGSNDGINYTQLRAFSIPTDKQGRNYKDLDTGLLTRATYRNYLLSMIATVDENTQIEYLDGMVDDDFSNETMR